LPFLAGKPESVSQLTLRRTPSPARIEKNPHTRQNSSMKKVVVFSDSSIFVHVVEDTAAEKTEE